MILNIIIINPKMGDMMVVFGIEVTLTDPFGFWFSSSFDIYLSNKSLSFIRNQGIIIIILPNNFWILTQKYYVEYELKNPQDHQACVYSNK